MKMNKKKLLSLALVIVLIAILSFGSLAWFADSESVENTFYVVSFDDTDADDIFSVDVYEEVDTNGDGILEKVDENGAVFEKILPGEHIVKAPYVENTGSYDQWVRLTITFASEDAWYKVFDGNAESPLALLEFYSDFDEYWVGESYKATGDAYVYVYYSKNPVTTGTVLGTFTGVNIPYQLTQEDMIGIKELSLKVTAEAVQTENLYKDGVEVTTAKDAFALVESTQVIGG